MEKQSFQRCIVAILAVFGLMGGLVGWAVWPLRHEPPLREPTRVLASDGTVLYELSSDGRGTMVPLDEIPRSLRDAVVTAEDARFWKHRGIDWFGLLRALRDNFRAGKVVSGASTIEEQLVKNFYFPSRKRTVKQKFREFVAARWWSAIHTKETTLEQYLNSVYFGNNLLGISAASQTYFRKPVGDLSIAESALLAGIISSPIRFDPYRHIDQARIRARGIIDRMFERGLLSSAQASEARAASVIIFLPKSFIIAPHFVFRMFDLVEEDIPDLLRGGYEIRTTIDPDLQRTIERVIDERLYQLRNNHVTNAAVMVVDPRSGSILSYAGGADFFNDSISGQINMAHILRAPGSALKPFLYFLGFTDKITPATIFADLPARFATERDESYYPRNYAYRYFGPVTARDALASSLNIPAVKLLADIGVPRFFEALKQFGVNIAQTAEETGLGIVLGGGEITLEDLVRGYAVLAAGGERRDLIGIKEIISPDDRQSKVLAWSANKSVWAGEARTLADSAVFSKHSERVAQAAYLVSDILSDRAARWRGFGEESLLQIGENRIAVKTGTTEDFVDNWAFGYTPDMVVGVWAGNADRSPMYGVTGVSGAVPIMHDIFQYVYRNRKPASWVRPMGMTEREICLTSGLLANDICPKTRREIFIEGTEPKDADTWYRKIPLDGQGRLVTAQCGRPVRFSTYLIPPAEYAGWRQSAEHEPLPAFDCRGNPTDFGAQSNTIIAPLDDEVFEIDDLVSGTMQGISFVAGGRRGPYLWHLNGKPIQSNDSVYIWKPQPGKYELKLEGADGQVRFQVK